VPVLKRNPDGPYYSQGDERAFFEWANRIPCIRKVEGLGQELHLHVRGRRVSETCLRELIALFYRYQVPMKQLAQFENSSNQKWFRNPSAFWYRPVFGQLSSAPLQPTSRAEGGSGSRRSAGEAHSKR
jgi:hypothetical protein